MDPKCRRHHNRHLQFQCTLESERGRKAEPAIAGWYARPRRLPSPEFEQLLLFSFFSGPNVDRVGTSGPSSVDATIALQARQYSQTRSEPETARRAG